jgi:flagellar basal-body rod modification protein FlgD
MASAIQNVASLGGAAAQTAATQSQTPAVDPLASESTFLTLLVEQLKNQDPDSPADGTQFVTQLAQFSQLEQTMEINSNVSGILADMGNLQAPQPSASGQG